MPRIYHSFDPYIVRIYGEFGIRWYSLAYILGFLLVRWYLLRSARAGEIRNLTEDLVDRYAVWAMLGALIVARFFHVFVFEFEDYGFTPLRWIAVWRGGLSFHGGLVGVVATTAIFCHRYKISFYSMADRAVIPVAVALGFGRLANFINAEMPGTLYNGPFCVDYSRNDSLTRPPAGCRHPTQLYEMIKNWMLVLLLWTMARSWRPPPGVVFWSFITAYGIVRFFLMFIRDESRIWLGLTESQIFSGVMATLGAIMVTYLLVRRNDDPHVRV